MKKNIFTLILVIALPFTLHAKEKAKQPAAAAAPSVDFISPKDGETVKSPFVVKMKVTGMKIKKAGEPGTNKTGHHHLLINSGWIEKGQAVPVSENHLHYGKGQTEAKLTLEPGDYILTMQFADSKHLSYGQEMSKTIRVKVEKK